MANAVIPAEGALYLLNKCKVAALLVKLYKNAIDVTKNSVLADFTVSTFASYAPKSAVFNSAVSNGAGDGTVTIDTLTWTVSASGPAENVVGWILVDQAAGKVIAGRRLTTPKSMTNQGDFFALNLSEVFGDKT